MSDQIKPFSSIFNFRDFGNYAGADGKRVRSGLLFRSGHYNAVSEADSLALDALGVSTILDLRAPHEREAYPSKWLGATLAPLAHDVDMPNAFMGFVTGGAVNFSSSRDYMLDSYTRLPVEPGHIDVFRAGFERLAEADGAFIVHCMAGKDRTGIFCALVHHVLGVSKEDRDADYLLTNETLDLQDRIALFTDFLSQHQAEPVAPDTVRALAGVHEDYLERAFETMRERAGSVEDYLESELNVGPVEIKNLRARYLD